jgi:hypothetical protein
MPTYDGIGSSITHRVEVAGDSLFQDVDGGTLSTKVPVQIFSNYYASPGSVDSSRQLRFRVQPDGESNVSNSYVTDMGVKGADGSNYFFITAPQNTSNVGDQNTFVISTTSNVGIGTTDPTKTLEVVGDIKCQTLSASTITGASPLVIDSDETITINAPIAMPSDAPMSIGTMTVSNIFHSDQLTMSAHVAMGSDKTLTTSNIVANTGDNLSLNSNLFVDTATGRVGIGVTNPSAPLHVYKNDTGSNQVIIENANQSERAGLAIVNALNEGFTVQHAGGTSNAAIIENYSTVNGGIHFYNKGDGEYKFHTTNNNTERMRISNSGNVGIGTDSPNAKLQVKYTQGSLNTISYYTTSTWYDKGLALDGGGNGFLYGHDINHSIFLRQSPFSTNDHNAYCNYGYHAFYTNGLIQNQTEKMRITQGGNVGIGITNPSYRLHTDGLFYAAAGQGGVKDVFYGINTNRSYGSGSLIRIGFGNSPTDEPWLTDLVGIGYGHGNHFFINMGRGPGEVQNVKDSVFYCINNNGTIAVHANGVFSKNSGAFKIDHPLPHMKDTHHLFHSFIEGPQADLIYRGKVQLVNGRAEINIDTVSSMTEGTFVALNRETQCFTSNETDWDPVKGSIAGNILTIVCQNTSSTATISWMVIGERHDKHMYDTGWTDENGKVIPEQLKDNLETPPE